MESQRMSTPTPNQFSMPQTMFMQQPQMMPQQIPQPYYIPYPMYPPPQDYYRRSRRHRPHEDS